MTVPLWLPYLKKRPISYYREAGKFKAPPLGWVLHVTVMDGSPFYVFENALVGQRKFSHGWIAKDGTGEQYAPTDTISWAQSAGNPTYRSWETEGFPGEPLTDAQIATLARIHVDTETPDLIANVPGQRGIGVHYMGGTAWGGHSCPDPSPGGQGPRSHQRQAIIDAAQGGTVNEADFKNWFKKALIELNARATPIDRQSCDAALNIVQVGAPPMDPVALVKALTPALTDAVKASLAGIPGLDAQQVADQVVAVLGTKLKGA